MPGAAFYTLLDPSMCWPAPCGVIWLQAANFGVLPDESCTFTVEVTVVDAKVGPTCSVVPDPGVTLCGPVTASITIPVTTAYIFTASVPLTGRCCISRPAFLRIELLSAGTCAAGQPGWATGNHCMPCLSFFEDSQLPLATICPDERAGAPFRNPMQYVDADCCDATPTSRGTWGRLKTMYR